jgi:RNA polymerase sigma factor (sigma-70 family)
MTETFDALWDRSAPKLRKFAYSLAKNRDDAEDLVSDAYIKCRRSFSGIENLQVFEVYAFRAVHRLHIDQAKRYKPLSTNSLATAEIPGGGTVFGEEWENFLTGSHDVSHIHVEELLDWMAPAERTLTQLRMMGLEFHEIGEAMGLTTTAVKSRHRRLRHNLRIAGYAA